MNILILTQKVDKNDPILGFFYKWILEFSYKFEKVLVVCLEKNEVDLPENVLVFSLGKEENNELKIKDYKLLRKIKYTTRFFKLIWAERKNYDVVFVHMNPEYVVLGGVFWKFWSKKIALWYTHRQKDLKLWLAEKLTNIVFTSSPQSFTLKSKKIEIMGHGVDVDFFKSIKRNTNFDQKVFIHVGRITQIKNCEVLIETANILKNKWSIDFKIKFLGDPILPKDFVYQKLLLNLVKKYNLEKNIEFMGSISPDAMAEFYATADASFNLAPTGGMDKSVIESVIAKVPTFASNLSFVDIYDEYKDIFMFKELDSNDLAKKVMDYYLILSDVQKADLAHKLSEKAVSKFSIKTLVNKIYFKLNETSK